MEKICGRAEGWEISWKRDRKLFNKKFVGENKNGLRFNGTIFDKYEDRKGGVLNGVIFK